MSKWVSILLCCVASNAFASPADSGRCPWKIPFRIHIQANGTTNTRHYYRVLDSTHDSSYSDLGVAAIDITLDTIIPPDSSFFYSVNYSVHNDTLHFARIFNNMYVGTRSTAIVIVFASGRDSIMSIVWEVSDYGANHPALAEGYGNDTFEIRGLSFDDTSIFSTDSSFSEHKIHFAEHSTYAMYSDPPNKGDGMFDYSDFTATSVDLSGIFRPTHFADQAAVAVATPPVSGLEITTSSGTLHCSFGVATEGRTLEVYSPLGVRIANYPIPAGTTEAQIKFVASGLYFVRLEGALAKICVTE